MYGSPQSHYQRVDVHFRGFACLAPAHYFPIGLQAFLQLTRCQQAGLFRFLYFHRSFLGCLLHVSLGPLSGFGSLESSRKCCIELRCVHRRRRGRSVGRRLDPGAHNFMQWHELWLGGGWRLLRHPFIFAQPVVVQSAVKSWNSSSKATIAVTAAEATLQTTDKWHIISQPSPTMPNNSFSLLKSIHLSRPRPFRQSPLQSSMDTALRDKRDTHIYILAQKTSLGKAAGNMTRETAGKHSGSTRQKTQEGRR